MSTLQFHLSFDNGAERLQLPVNPERITVSTSRGYEDIDVTQLGEYTIFGGAKLREFSFSSFFPREYNASYCEYSGFRPPWELVKLIERWQNTRKPIRFTLLGQIYGDEYTEIINTPATIRTFTYYEEGGAVGDISYELSLKEYTFVTFRRLTEAADSVTVTGDSERPDERTTPTEYEVASGDSLFKIAAIVYDDGDKWRTIYEANAGVIGPNPNVLAVGTKLAIPDA